MGGISRRLSQPVSTRKSFCREQGLYPLPMARNPIGFTPYPVTIITSLVYIALFAALLVVHHVVPSAPKNPTPKNWQGVNITQAWLDLEHLSAEFHPFISKSNVEIRGWLLERIGAILDANDADWKTMVEDGKTAKSSRISYTVKSEPKPVTVFDDNRSNITFLDSRGWVDYYEGTNIMVYIRGSEDDERDWWTQGSKPEGLGGVLVNAHYDSVSTGYGATDDGVGVVTVLQLISHFTKEGNQPKKGILSLLNNGEEDGLYGAHAFTKHPLATFPHSFLNLEGAGAGGRATLFRSTDAEVTKFYSKSKYPFGSVLSGDGFKRGVVRSGTDYSVFTEDLGMRGLDVAFMEPRARYHTSEDDARDTSIDSVWHMLSASLSTVKSLSDDASSTFEGRNEDEPRAGVGSTGVWFDVLGRAFAVMQLHSLFALSVTFLVAGPIIFIILEIIVQRVDKWYLFARKRYLHNSDDDEPVKLFGWRGFFRLPIAFVVAGAAVVALAYLITKINPYIIYSSEYAVWSMMLSVWLFLAWFLLRLMDSLRPSALARMYGLIWIYVLTWILLAVATVGENNFKLASGYFVLIYNAAAFAALLISYLEFFALPKKNVYVEHTILGPDTVSGDERASLLSHSEEPRRSSGQVDGEEANERTSLLNHGRQTFTRRGRRQSASSGTEEAPTPILTDPLLHGAYEGEQAWSSSMPRWTWLLQFLILAPINVILVGQIGLLATSALHQTPADGNPVFQIYLLVAGLSVLLLLPLTPFLHRMAYQIPTFLFLVFVGTLIYNLVAFPFSRDARLKVYFTQSIDLDHGNNTVALTGLDDFLQNIISELPSAAGTDLTFGHVPWASRNGLQSVAWEGLSPVVVTKGYEAPKGTFPNTTVASAHAPYKTWLSVNATRSQNGTGDAAVFDIQGLDTRACRLIFDRPVTNITIEGAGPDGRIPHMVHAILVPYAAHIS
ncbi:hypothetical protein M8818_003253 [Zalaria obscura]|uniref:Uncharacterized protein n=1 Tax=Zalaria obscura TaxID=2024903 RepID=A0ACC3SFE6_9PEZI